MKQHKIALLPGDGIGPEITSVTKKLLKIISTKFDFEIIFDEHPIGGNALELADTPLPKSTLEACKKSDAVLMASIGDPKYDDLPRDKRPETGLLNLRAGLGLFANIRPVKVWPSLIETSSLKKEFINGVDLVVVRELTGGIYFGKPKGRINIEQGERAFNTMSYSNIEIDRITEIAFKLAMSRSGKLCSVDKANVLDVSQLWRERVDILSKKYEEVEVTHLYVDNAAMQLIRAPRQFDVILTSNLFGDILSDEAAMLTGSIGMLPSASLNNNGPGLYEPVHGSAPDIAGLNKANPIAMVLSSAMMLRIALNETNAADAIEEAVNSVLKAGLRTSDLMSKTCIEVGCREMGKALIDAISGL